MKEPSCDGCGQVGVCSYSGTLQWTEYTLSEEIHIKYKIQSLFETSTEDWRQEPMKNNSVLGEESWVIKGLGGMIWQRPESCVSKLGWMWGDKTQEHVGVVSNQSTAPPMQQEGTSNTPSKCCCLKWTFETSFAFSFAYYLTTWSTFFTYLITHSITWCCKEFIVFSWHICDTFICCSWKMSWSAGLCFFSPLK